MHPEYHKGRTARIKMLRKAYEDDEDVRYVDAAKYRGVEAHAVSVAIGREQLAAASVATWDTDSSEETAIGLTATAARVIKIPYRHHEEH